jgi:hypothetical protein
LATTAIVSQVTLKRRHLSTKSADLKFWFGFFPATTESEDLQIWFVFFPSQERNCFTGHLKKDDIFSQNQLIYRFGLAFISDLHAAALVPHVQAILQVGPLRETLVLL